MASSHMSISTPSSHDVRRTQLHTAPQKRSPIKGSTPRVTTAPVGRQKSKPLYNEKPSQRLNPKTVDPFDKKTSKSSVFASAYGNGAIPCRLAHGSVKHKLQWTTPRESLNYDPVLVLFAEGLRETIHPYAFVANEGFIQLLEVDDADERVLPVLQKIISPIKMALAKFSKINVPKTDVLNKMSSDATCFQTTMNALIKLSDVTGPLLNLHLKNILPQV